MAWVEEAFGPKASLLCGYFHWVSGATDNAIYPSLFLKYIASYMHYEAFLNTDIVRFSFTVGITLVLAVINYSGLDIVGNLSMLVCVISMSPFVIMCILSIPKIQPHRWMVTPELDLSNDDDAVGFLNNPEYLGVHWRPLLNILFWNLNSFDVGASFAGELRNPERVFPRAMFLSVIFVVLAYLLPLLAALGATDTEQEDWNAGYLTSVSVAIGGSWLGAFTVLASAISNVALFEAEMSGDAYQLMGMADRGLIPKWFKKRSRFGTPVNGIIIGTLVIFLMSVADFDQLVEMLNFAYALSFLMEFSAFVKLRITDGDGKYVYRVLWVTIANGILTACRPVEVERPFRIPLNTFGCVCLVTPACAFLIYLMLIASRMTYVYCGALCCFGLCFHGFQKVAKHYHWVDYAEAPKRNNKRSSVSPSTASR